MSIKENQQTITNPFSPKNLFTLFFEPKKFFSLSINYPKWSILLSTFLLGIFLTIDRIDQRLIRHEMMGTNSELITWLTESWMAYWLWVILVGMIGGILAWFIYGWWYRIRLEWSGAINVDKDIARQIMVLQNLVAALPVVILTVAQTFIYSNYLQAYNGLSLTVSLIIFLFMILSCWVSYRAVTTVFHLNKLAIFWFLIFPIGFLILFVGLFILIALFAAP